MVNHVRIRNRRGADRLLGTLRENPGDVVRDSTLENRALQVAEEKFARGPTENFLVKNGTVDGKSFVLLALMAAPPPH